MATLNELREAVRSQTQTTSAELVDSVIDRWLQEAYNRTMAVDSEWPHFETTWGLTLTAGTSTVALPATLQFPGVVSLRDENGRRLEMVSAEWAEEFFSNSPISIGGPGYYSLWSGTITFWPTPDFDTDKEFTLRGYRLPQDWVADGASATPDCDSRLHLALATYAVAMAYAQQEDEILERTYMERWQRDVDNMIRTIMRPARDRPWTLGPHVITPIGRGTF